MLAIDWPEKPETLKGAKAVVLFFDGGDKHGFLKGDHLAQVQKLADAGVGLVHFHQVIDYPRDLGERGRGWMGAAWEKGYSQRAHWVAEFNTFADHPIFRGVTPFKIDDGWLFKLRFVPELKGVTPLLRTVSPKTPVALQSGSEDVVSWAYERPGAAGGRSFVFTGGHLHKSLGDEGYRKFLANGILWTAGVPIAATGARVTLSPAELNKSLEVRPTSKTPWRTNCHRCVNAGGRLRRRLSAATRKLASAPFRRPSWSRSAVVAGQTLLCSRARPPTRDTSRAAGRPLREAPVRGRLRPLQPDPSSSWRPSRA